MNRNKWKKRLAAMMTLVILFGMLPASYFGSGTVHAIAAQDAVEGLTWTSKSSGASTALRAAAYGNGNFVAVGTPPMPFTGNNGPMQAGDVYRSSPNGETWTTNTTNISHELRGVTYGSNGFVGVGYFRDYYYGQQKDYGQIATSSNGVNWNVRSYGTGNALFGVAYGSGVYVAVGATYDIDFNATPVILTSTNGLSWTQRYSQGSGTLNAITYGNDRFVAVGSLGTILTSTDGVAWSAGTSTITTNIRGVTYGDGVFLAVGSSGKILTSTDGLNWTLRNPPASHATTALWGAAYGKGTFLIVGNSGTILSSTDTVTWTARTSGTTNTLYAATYNNETFMVVGDYGTVLIAQYRLTYLAGNGGSITGTATQGVTPGASGTAVTATPNTGYHFVDWSDGGTSATRTDNNITADKSVTANFAINVYALNYAAGSGGTLTGAANQSVAHGSDGTAVTAVPNAHYHFTGWNDGNLNANRTDTNVTGAKNVTANFAIDTFNLSYSASAGGSITGAASQTVIYEANGAEVTATPDTGYHFVSWSDGITTEKRTDNQVTANKSVTASFAINQYTLEYAAGSNGSLTGTASQTVNHGSNGSVVTAVPAVGYHFVNWSDGITTASRTDLNVTGSKNVTASFAINAYSLAYTAGAGGSLTGTAAQTVNHGSDGTTVTAMPNVGYHFIGWSDTVLDASRKDLNVTGSINATANFMINAYTLNYLAGDGGSINGAVSQTVNHGSSGSEVTAVPTTGYHFVSWSDGDLSASRTDSILTDNKSVAASFAINEYTLSYSANAGGSLTGTVSQNVNHGSSGSVVTAVPATGYHFVSWSDGVATASRTDSNITSDLQVSASFAINQYTLTYSADANGSISGLASQNVNHGSDGDMVTAAPHVGYHFVSWSDGVLDASRTDLQVTGNKSVMASFAINKYSLAYSALAGGTISGLTAQQVDHGSNGDEVTAVPDTGYHFVSWSDGGTVASRTDMNVTGNKSVTASFAINEYTLAYAAGANGSLEGDASQSVNHGSDGTTVTAKPNDGYHFVSWSDGETNASRTEINVTGNKSVTASFAINEYTLTYLAGEGGTLTGEASQTVNHGASGTGVTAKPNEGYHFTGWSDGGQSASRTDSNLTGSKTVAAGFAINEYTLTYAAGANGSLEGSASQTVNHGSSGEKVTALPAEGYHFVSWSDGLLDASRTDSNIAGNIQVTASFAINEYALSYLAGTGGSINGLANQNVNHGSTGAMVTAEPDTGYHFVSWSDGGLSASRTDMHVAGNMSVTASFAINNYSLAYAADAGGTISGSAAQQADHGSDGSEVTAVPDTGYHFVSWSDGEIAASRTDINVTGDIQVTASFAINEYTLTYAAGSNGSLSGTASQTVNHGSSGSMVTANPAEGYHFVSWSDGELSASRTETNVSGSKSVTASFAINEYTLTYLAGEGGTLTGEASQTVNHGASGTGVTVTPDEGYHFIGWSDGVTTAARMDNNVTDDKSVTANFAINEYSLSYSAGLNGSLTGTVAQTVDHGLSGTEVTAVPAEGYHFVSWSDNLAAASRTDSSVTGNIQVTASFAINEYTLTYTTSPGGTLTGTASQLVNHGSNGTEVTAVPDPGYYFAGWSDGVTSDRRTDLQVTGNISVSPKFSMISLPPAANTDVEVLVNGKPQSVGTVTNSSRGEQTVKTIALDPVKLEQMLADNGDVITVQMNSNADVVIAELTGQMIKTLEQKKSVLVIKTEFAAYTLPANQIDISEVSKQLGSNVNLADLKIQIEISEPSADMVQVVANAANKNKFSIVVPPLNFSIQAVNGDSTIEISKFKAYVQRMVAIPDGVDPKKITTGIVVQPDGTVRHVPTKVITIDGKHYAVLNSLTNSIYSVISNPIAYTDVANHWAKDAVNDMGSRKIINGVGDNLFKPDLDITRAEFAAIIVRALGLKLEDQPNPFTDVKASDWSSSYIQTAYANSLISGFGEGTFRPTDKITREQAMTIIAKMMKLTGLQVNQQAVDAEKLLSPYADQNKISAWAREGVIACLQTGIVSGKNSKQLAPKDFISRAEVATLVQRILQKSDLI
ncbi:InlB B-repeat-containing protein [Candidatus Pristimantibacillus sp. PTI5]|uniref:InlB B-repeat-containing protein n=1 Tax=Candidatus Pristimantibacillus sp. PTI5 TaxID=3400422 RepID=UPI003B02204F